MSKEMKFRDYLTEKYITRVSFPKLNITSELFKNPSRKEILDTGGERRETRGFADIKSGNVWIWDVRILHDLVRMQVPEIPSGSAEIELDIRKKEIVMAHRKTLYVPKNWIKFLGTHFPGWKVV